MKYLLLLSLIYSIISDYEEDHEKCINIDYTNKNCWLADTKLSDYECCFIEYDNIDDGSPEKSCTFVEKRIGKIYSVKGMVELYREIYGIERAKNDPSFSPNIGIHYIVTTYTCQNYTYNMESNIRFSESEIAILKSEDHCLKYDIIFLINNPKEEVTEELCKNAKILPDSEKAGIKCALFELSFGSKIIKTCNLFNTNSNNLDYLTEDIEAIIESEGVTTFKIKISGDGISSNYDSETGELTNENENKNKSKKRYKNKSRFISVSKYLLLALLILF